MTYEKTEKVSGCLLGTAVGDALGLPVCAPGLNAGMVLIRNVVFAAVVLAHGFRRLAPPY